MSRCEVDVWQFNPTEVVVDFFKDGELAPTTVHYDTQDVEDIVSAIRDVRPTRIHWCAKEGPPKWLSKLGRQFHLFHVEEVLQ